LHVSSKRVANLEELYLIPQKMPFKRYGGIPKYLYRLAGNHEAEGWFVRGVKY
jgi:hypothetical protein